MPAGRPSKYKPEYCKKIVAYFSIEPYEERLVPVYDKKTGAILEIPQLMANDLPLLGKFAVSIDVSKDTVNEWAKVYPEFSVALKKAKELQRAILITNGLKGLYQTAYAIFLSKNITELRDNKEADLTDDKGKEANIFTVKYPTVKNGKKKTTKK